MSDCPRFRREWVGLLEGRFDQAGPGARKEHLAMCADCRRDWDDAEKILEGADGLQEDVRQAMASVDWDALSRRIADKAWEKAEAARSVSPARKLRAAFPAFRWRPVFVGTLAGLILGASVTYLALRPGGPRPALPSAVHAPGEFLDRVDMAVARRGTIDYLAKSQAFLLDFVQASPEEAARAVRSEASAGRTHDLLAAKRYIDPQLGQVRMAKAREICDQIESLFIELSQLSPELSAGEAAKIQRFVEDRQILLRIQILRKELEKSEV